jgi:two-component system NtrC family sensor kinase
LRSHARARRIPIAVVVVVTLGVLYETVLAFTSLLAPYRFRIPYAVPIFDTPFVLVATGVAYLCLERHRLRRDFQSVAIGASLWLAALLALGHIVVQPDYPGTPGLNPGIAPYLFFSSYLAAFIGVAFALRYPNRSLPLGDRARSYIGGAIVGVSAVFAATVVVLCPLLPTLVMPPGRMTPFAVWTAGLSNGIVALWALWRWSRRPRIRSQEDAFATLLALAAFIWLLGLVGFLLSPYRYAISWYLAGIARPVGVGIIFIALLREQVWLSAQARARLRDLEWLHRAGQALLGSLDTRDILDTIARHARIIGEADASLVFRTDGDVLRVVSGFGFTERADNLEIPLARSVSGLAVAQRKPVSTSDIRADGRFRLPVEMDATFVREGPTAALAVPLLAQRQEVVGALSLLYREPRAFAEADIELIAAFGTQASVALENVRAFDRLAVRAGHDAALQEFGQHMLEAADEAAAVDEAARLAHRLLQRDGVVLLLGGPRTPRRLVARAGWPAESAEAEELARAFEPSVVSALSSRANVEHDIPALRKCGVVSSIVVPLVTEGDPIGALVVYARVARLFDDEEKRVLRNVAQQTALALDKMRLYADLSDNLRRLQDTQAQLIQADKLKALGTLLSGMAHELNNPLSTIRLAVELLKRVEGVTGSAARRVDVIETACTRATRIISDLLVFARRQPPERELVDLNEVFRATLALQAPVLALHHIEVVTALEPGPPIWADSNQLQQVFLNLFSNAIHAMHEAHGRGILTIRSRRQGRDVIVDVDDTGPGISRDDLSRIFDPFFTTKPTGVGTGLGLSLAIGIIEAHGGRLGVENIPGAGARFTVRLPVDNTAPDRARAERVPTAPVENKANAEVLVVEDEGSLRDVLSETVRELGHQVVEATTGDEALARLRERTYDLVMLDLRLPDVDGQAVWQRALARDPRLAARVVFMTGDIMSAGTQRFLDQTGRPFLIKPFTVEELGRVIGEVLATSG